MSVRTTSCRQRRAQMAACEAAWRVGYWPQSSRTDMATVFRPHPPPSVSVPCCRANSPAPVTAHLLLWSAASRWWRWGRSCECEQLGREGRRYGAGAVTEARTSDHHRKPAPLAVAVPLCRCLLCESECVCVCACVCVSVCVCECVCVVAGGGTNCVPMCCVVPMVPVVCSWVWKQFSTFLAPISTLLDVFLHFGVFDLAVRCPSWPAAFILPLVCWYRRCLCEARQHVMPGSAAVRVSEAPVEPS